MSGYVYFIKPVGMDGPIKIGFSKLPQERLYTLSLWSPWPLEIVCTAPGNMSDEGLVHRRFAELHQRHEWFMSAPRLREAIEEVRKAGSLDPIRALPEEGNIRSRYHKRRHNPDQDGLLSYKARIRNVEKRLREQLGGNGPWRASDQIHAILERWEGNRHPLFYRAPVRPMADEFALLDAYLADPSKHSEIPEWKREAA